MSPKGASQLDLEAGIIGSAPAAERVADVMRLLPAILLREDPRVKQAYARYRARIALDLSRAVLAGSDPADPSAVMRGLVEDVSDLARVVKDLGLALYRWLPKMLFYEFVRASIEDETGDDAHVNVSVPAGLTWDTQGKRPKRKPGTIYGEGCRLEDLERNVKLFVRCEVLGMKKKRLARDLGMTRTNLQKAIHRTRTLLRCINAPDPTHTPITENSRPT